MSTISTPPPTSISPAPSPTERADPLFDDSYTTTANKDVSPMNQKLQLSRPIYLIVATTVSPRLGIGLKGSLPWGALRSDMAFFKRVTTESRPNSMGSSTRVVNAVIMGRKTWESIPARFRPLQGRLNVVLKSNVAGPFVDGIVEELRLKASKGASTPDVLCSSPAMDRHGPCTFISSPADYSSPILVSNSIEDALKVCDSPDLLANVTQDAYPAEAKVQVGNIFVIGGSQVYQASLSALEDSKPVRVLQTQVRRQDGREIECDTFFGEQLEGSARWAEVGREAVEEWAGTKVPQGRDEVVRDGEMEIRVVGWERK